MELKKFKALGIELVTIPGAVGGNDFHVVILCRS
jgi:hypothetical protein